LYMQPVTDVPTPDYTVGGGLEPIPGYQPGTARIEPIPSYKPGTATIEPIPPYTPGTARAQPLSAQRRKAATEDVPPSEYSAGGGMEPIPGYSVPETASAAPLTSVSPEQVARLPRTDPEGLPLPTPATPRQQILAAGRRFAGIGGGLTAPPAAAQAARPSRINMLAATATVPDPRIIPDSITPDPQGGSTALTYDGRRVHLDYELPNPALTYVTQQVAAYKSLHPGEEVPADWLAKIQEYALGLGKAPPRPPTKGTKVNTTGGIGYSVTEADGTTWSRQQIESGLAPADVTQALKDQDKAHAQSLSEKEQVKEETNREFTRRLGERIKFSLDQGDVKTAQTLLVAAKKSEQLMFTPYKNALDDVAHPSPSKDQGLVFDWVRAYVSGAAKMTNAEISKASKLGSYEQRITNWIKLAESGQFPKNYRQMLADDVIRNYRERAELVEQTDAELKEKQRQVMEDVTGETQTGSEAEQFINKMKEVQPK
jgi:hypothetical protein